MSFKIITVTGWEPEAGKTTISLALMQYVTESGLKALYLSYNNDDELFESTPKKRIKTINYSGHNIARIDGNACIHCNICKETCQYEAVINNGLEYSVNADKCTGCAECTKECPLEGISLLPTGKGKIDLFSSDYGFLGRSEAFAGEPDLYLFRYLICSAKKFATETGIELIVIDSPSDDKDSLNIMELNSGLMLFVMTEPTEKDKNYIKRIANTYLDTQIAVLINKSDYESGHSNIDFDIDKLKNNIFNLKDFPINNGSSPVHSIISNMEETGIIKSILNVAEKSDVFNEDCGELD